MLKNYQKKSHLNFSSQYEEVNLKFRAILFLFWLAKVRPIQQLTFIKTRPKTQRIPPFQDHNVVILSYETYLGIFKHYEIEGGLI